MTRQNEAKAALLEEEKDSATVIPAKKPDPVSTSSSAAAAPKTSRKELDMLARAASEFAKKQLAPNREENDTYPFGPFFDQALAKAFDVDFFHVLLPESMGGMNQGLSALAVMLDQICREDSAMGGIIFTTLAAQELMMAAGATAKLAAIATRTEVRSFLIGMPVFNNPSDIRHLADAKKTGDTWMLDGHLDYLVLGDLAGQALIPAARPGSSDFSWFLVDLSDPKISKSEPVLSLGFHACPAVDVAFSGVPAVLIGEEGKGAQIFDTMADRMHVAAAAMAEGVMKGSFRDAFDYAKKREQGGQTIIHWSQIKMMLSAMAVTIKNAEMIVERVCEAADAREPHWQSRARAAALHIQELACDLTTDGIQILGGVGYMKDFGQEKRFRDAKQIQALLGMAPVKKIRFIEQMI
jgi:alkylation response protein AidB-like acyl-CoA dehydrogenase